MSSVGKTLEMGGIPPREFIEYFIELGCCHNNENTLIASDWEVTLQTRYEWLGSIKIVRVDLIFKGEEKILEEVIKVLRFKFLRAGG